jgi:hypothetical protein
LEIFDGFIFFDNTLDLGENIEVEEISQAEAIAISGEFVEMHFPDFAKDMVLDTHDGSGFQVIYRQVYRGQVIWTNYIELLVTTRGIEWIEMQFGRVIGHSAEPRMIFAPDEILLTFMQRMRHEAMENPIIISGMDIVYFLEYASDTVGQVYPAVPFYRIFILDRDSEFLINAYTNMINF